MKLTNNVPTFSPSLSAILQNIKTTLNIKILFTFLWDAMEMRAYMRMLKNHLRYFRLTCALCFFHHFSIHCSIHPDSYLHA